jgi:uncharacterized protein
MTWMSWPLLLAALAMGLAAAPHCALMCGAACTALTRSGGRHAVLFHGGRVLGYSVAGAVVASSVATLGAWAQHAPAWRPLWTLLHLGLLGLGLWWLVMGRQPAWMQRRDGVVKATNSSPVSSPVNSPVNSAGSSGGHTATLHFHRPGTWRQPWRAGGAGLAWVAWPCAAVQAALLLAVLAPSAAGGALVMGTFALASLPGLVAAPWAWSRWQAWRGPGVSSAEMAALGLRVGGAALVLSSSWVLAHGMWQRVAAWCLS